MLIRKRKYTLSSTFSQFYFRNFSHHCFRCFQKKGGLLNINELLLSDSDPLPSTGIHSKKELKALLDLFATKIKESGYEDPIAFLIIGHEHTISVSYDPQDLFWTLFDANSLFPKRVTDSGQCAKLISEAYQFRKSAKLYLDIQIYIAGKKGKKRVDQLKQAIKKLRKEPFFQEIYRTDKTSPEEQKEWMQKAISHNDVASVKALIQGGFDPSYKDVGGDTLLNRAAYFGHTETVKTLLQAGADPLQKNNDGKTARTVATEYGHLETAEVLLAAENHWVSRQSAKERLYTGFQRP